MKSKVVELAEESLDSFAKLIGPHRLYGQLHEEVFHWITRSGAKDNQLILLPRGHLKSHCIAVWCAWYITKNPDTTILYVSATEELALLQLSAIKDILTSDIYRKYWPNMVHPDEAKRAKWNATEIMVDHPRRSEFGIRDYTIAARSIKGNTVGLHCDVAIFDDIVVPTNAYTEEGRKTVASGYSLFSSVKNPTAITKVIGTRYDPKDIYGSLVQMEYDDFDEDGNLLTHQKIYEVFEKEVEEESIFIWPREQHLRTKKWYGFNAKILSKIKAEYLQLGEAAQFFAQYYNNPNDPTSSRFDMERFQYYDPKFLAFERGVWYFKDKELAIYAAADLAYTKGDKSDYTALIIIGMDNEGFIYVLDINHFRTDKYEEYYNKILSLYEKWKFRKIKIETGPAANLIVNYLKDQARREGKSFVIDGKPAPNDKSKLDRIHGILEPRYENKTIWHYRGGYMNLLEEQLILSRPQHDDLKDALAMAVEIAKPSSNILRQQRTNVIQLHSRFGGYIRA